MAAAGWAARLEALAGRHWWRPRVSWLCRLLQPLSWLVALLAWLAARGQAQAAPVPVVVVGNLVVGGAGKTPTVIAVVRALQAAGWQPGVISRGHGRTAGGICAVAADGDPAAMGDEPILIARTCGVPVWVGRRRVAVARALCAAHPAVDVLVSDDGLQHHALARCAEILVFDERGVGNGLRLPAGPLREPLPSHLRPGQLALYNAGCPSTPLPGRLALRSLRPAVPLAAWRDGTGGAGTPLQAFRGRPLLAVAGTASPARFFGMLAAAGLDAAQMPLPDHHPYTTLPWPAGTADVLTTEKDAVKLQAHAGALGATRVWVVGLDFSLSAPFVRDLLAILDPLPQR